MLLIDDFQSRLIAIGMVEWKLHVDNSWRMWSRLDDDAYHTQLLLTKSDSLFVKDGAEIRLDYLDDVASSQDCRSRNTVPNRPQEQCAHPTTVTTLSGLQDLLEVKTVL